MTLTEFLLARIAEDEADARKGALYSPDDGPFVRWDSDRMLTECEAKRAIVEQTVSGFYCMTCRDALAESLLRDTLGYLTLPYVDHPDFKEEWRPV
jgi:hypothetical protein